MHRALLIYTVCEEHAHLKTCSGWAESPCFHFTEKETGSKSQTYPRSPSWYVAPRKIPEEPSALTGATWVERRPGQRERLRAAMAELTHLVRLPEKHPVWPPGLQRGARKSEGVTLPSSLRTKGETVICQLI